MHTRRNGAKVDCRPNASRTASGKARPKPTVLKISVSGKPPHKAVGAPPANNTALMGKANAQALKMTLGLNTRAAVRNNNADHTTNTTPARHCSSSG